VKTESSLEDSLSAKESELMTGPEGDRYPGIPDDKSDREQFPIRVSAMGSISNEDEIQLYYATATKMYPSPGWILRLQGWFVGNNNDLSFIKNNFGIGDADGKMLPPSVKPHVVFILDNRVYVGAELWYYEGEAYRLFEITKEDQIELIHSRMK